MISAPEDFLRFFDNGSACISYEFDYFVDFLLTVNIICQCDTTKTISKLRRTIWINVFCQQIQRKQFKFCSSCVKETYRWIVFFAICAETQFVPIEDDCTFHIRYTQTDTSDFVHRHYSFEFQLIN